MVLDVAAAGRRVEELIATLVEVQGVPYPRWRILFRLRSDAPASSALVAEIDQHQWLTGIVVMDSDSIRWQNDLATTLSQGSRSGIVYWQLDADDFLPSHALRLAAVLLRATPSPAGAAQAVFHVPRRRRVRQIPHPLLPVLGSDGGSPVPLPLPLLVERREAGRLPGKPARGR